MWPLRNCRQLKKGQKFKLDLKNKLLARNSPMINSKQQAHSSAAAIASKNNSCTRPSLTTRPESFRAVCARAQDKPIYPVLTRSDDRDMLRLNQFGQRHTVAQLPISGSINWTTSKFNRNLGLGCLFPSSRDIAIFDEFFLRIFCASVIFTKKKYFVFQFEQQVVSKIFKSFFGQPISLEEI